jgi:hypothetical protein
VLCRSRKGPGERRLRGWVRPAGASGLRLSSLAHAECNQASCGTEASAGPLPELWPCHDAGFRLLLQLPRAPTAW